MASWSEFESEAPELATRVRALFQARKHKTMATVRADGSPRISGIETEIDTEVRFGSMPDSRKLADLLRDPRVALHSPSVDPPPVDHARWVGEAKLAGTARQEADGFTVDLTEVVLTYLDQGGPDHAVLVIDAWHPGRGVERHLRE